MASNISSIRIVIDNSNKAISAMKSQLQTGLMACGTISEGYAKGNSPVDTGRLRNSIAWAVKEKHSSGGDRDTPLSVPKEAEVYIGTNVDYAQEQEFKSMNHRVGKAHFLRDSISTHIDEYKATIKAALDT